MGPRFKHDAQCLPVWKQSGPMLSAGCAHVGPSWPLGPMLGQVGPMLSYVGPILGPMLSPLGSYVGAMFGPSMLKRS